MSKKKKLSDIDLEILNNPPYPLQEYDPFPAPVPYFVFTGFASFSNLRKITPGEKYVNSVKKRNFVQEFLTDIL